MYLAVKRIKGRPRYLICESYRSRDEWRSRELMDLGEDPTRFIEYPGGRTYYIREEVEEKLISANVKATSNELEDIFWPFLRPDVRHAQEHFRNRSLYKSKPRMRMGTDEEKRLDEQIHEFDRRRLQFLRTGAIDLSRIRTVPMRYFRKLADKSREEIEQYFRDEEFILSERELKRYLYASFDLQRFFATLDARSYPEFLDQARVDQVFLDSVCQMQKDRRYWRRTPPREGLSEHLVRYVIMFYDNEFGSDSFLSDFIHSFIGSHRRHVQPKPRPTLDDSEARQFFGKSKEELLALDKRSLAKLYKHQAMQHHPDHGGDHEKFIRLTAVYKAVIHHRRTA
jgi:hypothetical protein